MWSLDGSLRYLPVAALHDGNRYVVEQYRNVVITLATNTRLKDTPSRRWKGLGLGVSKAIGEFSPLPGVPDEMRLIREETVDGNNSGVNSGGVLPGR